MRIIPIVLFLGLITGLLAMGVYQIQKDKQKGSWLSLSTQMQLPPIHSETTGEKEIATVSAVIDGDTIVLTNKIHVRYIGIDTPEIAHPYFNQRAECYGIEATEANKKLVKGKTVILKRDVSNVDKYGRELRYVWVDGTFVNETLVKEGYARVDTVPPDTIYQSLFVLSELSAKLTNKGMWGTCAQ